MAYQTIVWGDQAYIYIYREREREREREERKREREREREKERRTEDLPSEIVDRDEWCAHGIRVLSMP